MIDLRSDTVTKPTSEMLEAAMNAKLGDDVFGDDPTVNELETYAADLLGFDAALFVSSGTQGNLVSILTHTNPGDEVLVEEASHSYNYEVGGISAIAGVIPRIFTSDKGYQENISQLIRPSNIHFPPAKLLCLENTHNSHGGYPLSEKQVAKMSEQAHETGLKVHLDGARIFNAVAYHQIDVKNYTKHVDSIQICLSKGLSAPIGSIIAGDENFIERARKKRKMLGGGMRQVGIIAAPGLVALKTMRDRLVEDHRNATLLSNGLKNLGINVGESWTNIVICDVSSIDLDAVEAISRLHDAGILAVSLSTNIVRLTTHRHITEVDVSVVLSEIKSRWIS